MKMKNDELNEEQIMLLTKFAFRQKKLNESISEFFNSFSEAKDEEENIFVEKFTSVLDIIKEAEEKITSCFYKKKEGEEEK